MMTLLDDHQIYFRHQGILAVSAFLARTPPVLLRRTGLNDLIQQVCLIPLYNVRITFYRLPLPFHRALRQLSALRLKRKMST